MKGQLSTLQDMIFVTKQTPLLHHKKAFQEIKTSNSITTPPLHSTHKQFYFQQRCLVLVGHAHSVVGQHAQQTWFHRKGVSTSHLKEGRKERVTIFFSRGRTQENERMHQVPHKLTACNTVEWSCCALYTHIFCVRIASTA